MMVKLTKCHHYSILNTAELDMTDSKSVQMFIIEKHSLCGLVRYCVASATFATLPYFSQEPKLYHYCHVLIVIVTESAQKTIVYSSSMLLYLFRY